MRAPSSRAFRTLGVVVALVGSLVVGSVDASPAHAAPAAKTVKAGTYAYVVTLEGQVWVIDTSINTAVKTISLPREYSSFRDTSELVASPDGRRVYVAVNAYDGNKVFVIDTSTASITGSIDLPAASSGVEINRSGTRLYLTAPETHELMVVDTSTSAVTAVGVGEVPLGVTVSPDGSRVYVANMVGLSVSVIDAATNTVVATIPVESEAQDVAVSPDGTRVYAVTSNDPTACWNCYGAGLATIDTATNTVISWLYTGGDREDGGVAVSPDGRRVYVTYYASIGNGSVGLLRTVDTATNTVMSGLDTRVGDSPRRVTLNAAGTRAYVPSDPLANNLTVIDTSKILYDANNNPAGFAIAATLPLGARPFDTAIVTCGTACADTGPVPTRISNPRLDDLVPGFGYDLDISGDTAIVGMDKNDPEGRAHIYVREQGKWVLQAELVGSGSQIRDGFASSVAISGDTVVVGALTEGERDPGVSTGAAYVFVRNGTTWTQQTRLAAPQPIAGAQFGVSVDIDGDRIVVGSRDGTGAAYVYERSSGVWSETARLAAADGGGGFGLSAALSGGTVVVGAPYDDHRNQNGDYLGSGSAYVFSGAGSAWSQRAKLTHIDPANPRSVFGSSVDTDGRGIVVGAPPERFSSGVGKAYVFAAPKGKWAEEAQLTPPAVPTCFWPCVDAYGTSVAISGRTVVVGGGGDSDGPAAYVLKRQVGSRAWSEAYRLHPLDRDGVAGFGFSVAISRTDVAVGAPWDNTTTSSYWNGHGSAWMFAGVK